MNAFTIWIFAMILASVTLGVTRLVPPRYVLLGSADGDTADGVLVGLGVVDITVGLTYLLAAAISLVSWLDATRWWGRGRGQNRVSKSGDDVKPISPPREPRT